MILGVEGIHTWGGGLALGDLSSFPRYRIDGDGLGISGLAALGDAEDVRDLAVGRVGEIPRKSLRRGKTVVYTGLIEARTLADLRSGEDALRGAFGDQELEKSMVVTPKSSATWIDPAFSSFYRARALTLDIPDAQGTPHRVSLGYERPFVLAVRSSSPFHFLSAASTLTFTSGASATPAGTAPADPVLRINGPKVVSRIRRQVGSRDESLYVAFDIPSGTFIEIDFRLRTIVNTTGADVSQVLTPGTSDWWGPRVPGLVPGVSNTLSLPGATGAGSAVATWNPAFW